MANKKEAASAAQTGAENANVLAESSAENATINTETGAENVKAEAVDTAKTPEEVEVPENAEEITQEEALQAAADEVNRLREENTAIKQQLDDIVKKTNEEAAIAGKQIHELEEKLAAVEKVVEEKDKQLEAAAKTSGSNAFYVDLLNNLEEKFNNYSGIRRERLRSEFITDIKEEIQRQKEQLTNA